MVEVGIHALPLHRRHQTPLRDLPTWHARLDAQGGYPHTGHGRPHTRHAAVLPSSSFGVSPCMLHQACPMPRNRQHPRIQGSRTQTSHVLEGDAICQGSRSRRQQVPGACWVQGTDWGMWRAVEKRLFLTDILITLPYTALSTDTVTLTHPRTPIECPNSRFSYDLPSVQRSCTVVLSSDVSLARVVS